MRGKGERAENERGGQKGMGGGNGGRRGNRWRDEVGLKLCPILHVAERTTGKARL